MVALTLLSCVLFSQEDFAKPELLVEASDAYYQSQFANLEFIKMGKFGTSRVEISQINAHGRDGGDPAYRSKAWYSSVSIYGSHGKPLTPKTLSRRYSRFANGESVIAPKEFPQFATDKVLADAIMRFSSAKAEPLVIRRKSAYAEIRPVRLSKSECLKCHTDMKLGDPVALMVYVVSRKKPANSLSERLTNR